MALEFGGQLRTWRGKRRMSQLQLALAAEVSARHIAFLETGRAKPSRRMVLLLGDALEVPRADRNLMLDAAGFRAAYASRPLDSAAMEPIRKAITHMIEGHSPYPAFVFDRHWRVLDANASGRAMLSGFGLDAGDSFIDFLLGAETIAGRAGAEGIVEGEEPRLDFRNGEAGYGAGKFFRKQHPLMRFIERFVGGAASGGFLRRKRLVREFGDGD